MSFGTMYYDYVNGLSSFVETSEDAGLDATLLNATGSVLLVRESLASHILVDALPGVPNAVLPPFSAKAKCACGSIPDPLDWLPPPVVPDGMAPAESNVTITVNGQEVRTTRYVQTLERVDATIEHSMWVDPSTHVRRSQAVRTSSVAGYDTKVVLDMWNVGTEVDPLVFQPPTMCKCMNATMRRSPFPNTCANGRNESSHGCRCPEPNVLVECDGFGTYPVLDVAMLDVLDDAVNTSHSAIIHAFVEGGGTATDDCRNATISWLCQFYMPLCQDGLVTYPELPPLDDVCGDGFISDVAIASSVAQDYRLADHLTAVPEEYTPGSTINPHSIGSMLIYIGIGGGGLLLIGSLVWWYRNSGSRRRRRADGTFETI